MGRAGDSGHDRSAEMIQHVVKQAGQGKSAWVKFHAALRKAGAVGVVVHVAADSVERGSELGWCLGLVGCGQRDEHLRTNADDRLPRASLRRVEGGEGVVEGRDVADVRPQSSVTHPPDDLTQLGTIGLDNEVHR